jgi:hypothetical protein
MRARLIARSANEVRERSISEDELVHGNER